jgi:ribosomal protein S18 acetylase RimI-like enzyme
MYFIIEIFSLILLLVHRVSPLTIPRGISARLKKIHFQMIGSDFIVCENPNRINSECMLNIDFIEKLEAFTPATFVISEYLSLHLVELDKVDAISDLVVDSYYKRIIPENVDDEFALNRFRNSVLQKIDDFMKKSLRTKLREGFLTRAYNRFANPTLSWSEESVIVALNDSRFPETILAVIEVCPTKEPYLCNLAVSSSYRRQGYARILCEFCEMLVMEYWGKRALTLHVDRSNLAARRLYESMNYTESDRYDLNNLLEPNKHKNLVYYRKDLEYPSTGRRAFNTSQQL